MKLFIVRDHRGDLLTCEHITPFGSSFTMGGEITVLPSEWFPELTYENSPKELIIKEIVK
jgi:hypothetical protein